MEHRSHGLATRLFRHQLTLTKIGLRYLSKFDPFGNAPVPPNKQRFIPTAGTYPLGFRVGSVNVGIKADATSRPDLVLVVSDRPSSGAAVFTKNEFPAASITVSKEILQKTKGHGLRGVIANSWCANLFTGKDGLQDALMMSREANKYVSGGTDTDRVSSVMVMHTGIANQRLPMKKILDGMPKLYQDMGNSHEHWLNAATGIRTSDTFPKVVSRTYALPSSPDTTFSIAGITKGAGMIHPNMATTLGIICTDAPITPFAIQQLLSSAADKSYNCISIEGDTSANDMVAMLANGAAGGITVDFDPKITAQSADFVAMQRILIKFAADMAKLVVRDGEGATKFITIRVRRSPSPAAAKHIASAIARSVLVKTGMFGRDPTWEGAVAALGYSLLDTPFEGQGIIVPEMTSVSFVPPTGSGELKFLDRGVPVKVDGEKIKAFMEQEDVEVVLDLRDDGKEMPRDFEEAVYWTCDLTHQFVTINGA